LYEAEVAGGKRDCKMIFAVPCGRDMAIKTDSKITFYINFCYLKALGRKVTVLNYFKFLWSWLCSRLLANILQSRFPPATSASYEIAVLLYILSAKSVFNI